MRKCKTCKQPFKPVYNTIQATCSPKCALEYSRIEQKKQKAKAHRQQKREFKLNDKSTQRAAAQRAFNAFIRFRDRNEGCISCDNESGAKVKYNAGHFKSVGARPDLRFNENNVAKQCERCNSYLSGNAAEFRKSLVKRIGIKSVEKLERVTSVRYTAEDYRNIAIEYRAKLKALRDRE